MAVELRNGLALAVDRPLPATLSFESPDIRQGSSVIWEARC